MRSEALPTELYNIRATQLVEFKSPIQVNTRRGKVSLSTGEICMKKKVRRRPSIDIIQSYSIIIDYEIAALLWFCRKQ